MKTYLYAIISGKGILAVFEADCTDTAAAMARADGLTGFIVSELHLSHVCGRRA